MQDWNVAERERQVRSADATDEQCYRTGSTHRAYEWARSPCGAWSERQVALYNLGFDGAAFPG